MNKLVGLMSASLILAGLCSGISDDNNKHPMFPSIFNLTEYYQMPPQYSGDDYVRCMIEGDDALWCTAWNIIKPNRSNPIWNVIERYSNNTKKHYRHDLVQSSTCIKWCMKELEGLDEEYLKSLDEPAFDFHGTYKIDESIFYNSSQYKEKYDTLVQRCRNKYFTEAYGLRAHTGIVYCYSPLEDRSPDSLDWAFVVVFLTIIGILTFGSLLDCYLNKEHVREHFEAPINKYSLGTRLALAFSVPRNWYRLHARPKTQMARDLRYIQGLRFTTIFLVVYGHAIIVYGFSPVSNTEFIEEQYYHFWDMIAVNGMNVVQTFFAIGGFLMGVQFFDLTAKRKFNFGYFWVAMIYRYIRLTPVYALVLFYDATWLYKSDMGPFWKTTTETEKSFCRRNWWTNMLYINNYVNPSQMCMTQSWYLAADFQLFAVGLLVMMAMWRFPKVKNQILYACLFVSYLIPAVITYVKRYDGVFSLSPHDKKFIFHPIADGFLNYYIPAHTNAGNYFAGLGMAMLYNNYKKNRVDITKYKSFIVAFYAIFPIGLLAFLSAWLFYNWEWEKPAIWIAIFAAFSKNIWGIMGAFLMFGFIAGIGGIIRNFFHLPIFTPLGRIAYCIYLIHFDVFRLLMGDFRALPSVSQEPIILLTCGGFLISVGVAMVLCITLEFPFTALLKELTGGKMDEAEKPPPSPDTDRDTDSDKSITVELTNGRTMVDIDDKDHINSLSHEVRL